MPVIFGKFDFLAVDEFVDFVVESETASSEDVAEDSKVGVVEFFVDFVVGKVGGDWMAPGLEYRGKGGSGIFFILKNLIFSEKKILREKLSLPKP